jgi:hypothetical protein
MSSAITKIGSNGSSVGSFAGSGRSSASVPRSVYKRRSEMREAWGGKVADLIEPLMLEGLLIMVWDALKKDALLGVGRFSSAPLLDRLGICDFDLK